MLEGRPMSAQDLAVFDEAYLQTNFGRLSEASKFFQIGIQVVQDEQLKLEAILCQPEVDSDALSKTLHLLSGSLGTLGYLNFTDWCRANEAAITEARNTEGASQSTLTSLAGMLLLRLLEIQISLVMRSKG
jgi:abortive infection bacteriophage resistance protein